MRRDIQMKLRRTDTHSEETALSEFFYLPFEKGFTLEGKHFHLKLDRLIIITVEKGGFASLKIGTHAFVLPDFPFNPLMPIRISDSNYLVVCISNRTLVWIFLLIFFFFFFFCVCVFFYSCT